MKVKLFFIMFLLWNTTAFGFLPPLKKIKVCRRKKYKKTVILYNKVRSRAQVQNKRGKIIFEAILSQIFPSVNEHTNMNLTGFLLAIFFLNRFVFVKFRNNSTIEVLLIVFILKYINILIDNILIPILIHHFFHQ
tara:strand:+ start:190 stop:594 length:405 start_codon:yes stop_codon:yes gene_type:complete